MSGNTNLPENTSSKQLVYQGHVIRDRGEMISLTDMWKAAGSPSNREPFNWARKEGAAFIEAVAVTHNLPDSQVMAKKQGKSGGTFGHWQIAIAFAKYLSPEFHMWCNEVVRAHMEGELVDRRHIEDQTRDLGISKATIKKITALENAVYADQLLNEIVGLCGR